MSNPAVENKSGRTFRPGLLSRVSSLVLIQVVFVFVALCLILFYPHKQVSVGGDVVKNETILSELTDSINGLLRTRQQGTVSLPYDTGLAAAVAQEISRYSQITHIEILLAEPEGGWRPVYRFDNPGRHLEDELPSYPNDLFRDDVLIEYVLDQPPGYLLPMSFSTSHAANYYRVDFWPGMPAVLVSISEHGLYMAERSHIVYTVIMLFLSSVLISLLTAYFISEKFKAPLKKLLYGLRKTTEGELYHIVDTGGTMEVHELEVAYNHMTNTLWENERQLKRVNRRLLDTNYLLLGSQSFLGTLIDVSPAGVMTVSAEGNILLFNRKASQLLGYSAEELLGEPVDRLFAGSSFTGVADLTAEDDAQGFEVLCKTRDGRLFPAYLSATPLKSLRSIRPAYLLVVRDISESRSFQEMMVRIDRLYTRGEMAGDIAHEVNNHLAVISGLTELMPMLLARGETEKITERLRIMNDTVEQIASFAAGLMDHEAEGLSYQKADLNQIIENLLAFLKPQNRFDRIDIETDLSTELQLVELDPAEIQQVLVNLIQNAADAIRELDGNRRIVIRTSRQATLSGDKACIEVHDSGPGIPAEHLPVMFRRRFTTKRKGAGIGLVTCKKILDLHHGVIAYRYLDGALFRIELPLTQPPSTPLSQAAAEQVSSMPVSE